MRNSVENTLSHCTICPRRCGVDRTKQAGFCGAGAEMEVAKIMLHHWEEPCISGRDPKRGSGAIFFMHCSLGCVYCQNKDISRPSPTAKGAVYTIEALADKMLRLEDAGAYNINLVTPTHYAPQIAASVTLARTEGLTLPIVWNTGGYETAEGIAALSGIVDIFLTDFKYASPQYGARFSHAADYGEAACAALPMMREVAGKPEYGADGMMKRGVIVRHLILPGCRADSIAVLGKIASLVPPSEVVLSLMSQYTPEFFTLPPDPAPEEIKLTRRVTTFEYNSVVEEAIRLGFDGYTQEKASASSRYTPVFL